jgi:transcription elongation factor Elf1
VREQAWRTNEPCPVCGTGLTVVDNGRPTLQAECRLCGYVTTWDHDEDGTGGDQ